MMRRKLWKTIIGTVLTASLLLTGCGAAGNADVSEVAVTENDGNGTGESESSKEGKTTVTFYANESEASLTALQDLINKYNSENTDNIYVEVSAPSDYETLIKTMMASNNLPDIFGTHGWAVRRYDDYLYDLSNEEWAQYLSDDIRSVITDSDGKLCCLSIGQAIEGIQFNKDVLDEYGVDPEKLGTWDEFVEALKTIRDKSNGEVAPIYLAGSEPAIIGLFTNALSAVNIGNNPAADADKLLTGEDFDWSYMTEVIKKYKELSDEGLLNDGYLTAQVPDMIQAIATGKCAFIFLGTQVVEAAVDVNPELNWGFMPFPAMTDLGAQEPAFTNGEQGAYGVWKDSPNREAALKVLDFLAQPENVSYYCAKSAKPTGLVNAEVDLGKESNTYFEIFKETKAVGQFDRTYLPNGMFDVMSDAQSKVLLGSIDETAATDMIKSEYERLSGTEN